MFRHAILKFRYILNNVHVHHILKPLSSRTHGDNTVIIIIRQ